MSKNYSNLYRTCMECKVEKYATEFYIRNKKTMRRHSRCKTCDIARVRKRHQDNPERTKNNDLKRLYGITLNEYNQMLVEQENRCKTCGTTNPGGKYGKFMVDHCHITNKVRGLLCKSCNIALGEIKDNRQTLLNMLQYLDT